MEQYLIHSIHSSLSLGLNDNARFLAERLVAAEPSEVCRFMPLLPAVQVPLQCHAPTYVAAPLQAHKYLLATCYRHCNQGYRAVQLLKGQNHTPGYVQQKYSSVVGVLMFC